LKKRASNYQFALFSTVLRGGWIGFELGAGKFKLAKRAVFPHFLTMGFWGIFEWVFRGSWDFFIISS
jgi:hypothetical protein